VKYKEQLQEIAAIKEQLDKEKKELLETTHIEAAEKDKISKELGTHFIDNIDDVYN
jgi:hypothetical protein